MLCVGRRVFSSFFCLLGILICTALPGGLLGQDNLPSESELPEDNVSFDLPAEGELPTFEEEWTLLPDDLPGPRLRVADDLPSESELPIDSGAVDDPLYVSAFNHLQKVLPPIGMPAGNGPWLRMSFRGHTATVRSLQFTADSSRLCSAGDDKVVHVWTQNPLARNATPWMHEQFLRWQIQRGPRGRIYAMSAGQTAAAGQQLAVAGHGAMTGLGEISVFDPVSGKLRRALYDETIGHRQVIAAVAQRGQTLLSADVSGKVIVWRPNAETGIWRAKVLYDDDLTALGAAAEKQLQPWRRFVPVVLLDNDRAVVPRPALPLAKGAAPNWELELIDLKTGGKKRLEGRLPGMVISLTTSADGNLIAASDATRTGVFSIWNVAKGTRQPLTANATVLSLQFSNSNHLLVGTQRDVNGNARLQRWHPQQGKFVLLGQQLLRENVLACAISPDGTSYAYGQADRILVGRWQDFQQQKAASRQVLAADVQHPTRVAFVRDAKRYRIAIAVDPAGKVFKESFDLDQLQFGRENNIPVTNTVDGANGAPWTLKRENSPAGPSYTLYFQDKPKVRLPIELHIHGAVTSRAWIRDVDGQVAALAIGTAGRNEISVFRLTADAGVSVWQNFRGHEDAVTSIGISTDRRYLVSAARDGTIRFWNLATLVDKANAAKQMQNRWGL
ncbi:MAG: WD40 repeat protein, partial [Pirellulaceae bacterium]